MPTSRAPAPGPPARGPGAAGRRRAAALLAAALAAAALAAGPGARAPAAPAAPAAAAAAWLGPPRAAAAAGPARRRGDGGASTAARAAARAAGGATKARGGRAKGKYRGAVNPGLRSLLGSEEYRRMVSLLSRLNDQGSLDGFLERAEAYWRDINIFKLALEEQQGGGRAIVNTVRRDWARIWPEELDAERMTAFDVVTDFWKRLDRSKLVDKVMQEVLPDSQKDYEDLMESADQQRLASMSDEERRDEIMQRLGSSEIIKQYAILSQNDPELQSIGGRMTPFIANFVATLERKIATQTEALGKTIDYGLIAVGFIVVLGILFALGVVKLP